jgi:hypothetical protein
MKNYEKPVVTITEFNNVDVVTTSAVGLVVTKFEGVGENVIDF